MPTITSNGTGGGNWSVGASWTGGVAPVAGDTARIISGDTITVDDACRAAFKVEIGEAGVSDGTLSFAASSKLTIDDTVGAGLDFQRGGILTDAVGITGAFAEITAQNFPTNTNKWTVTVDINFTGDVTTQRLKLTGGKYGLVGTNVTFRELTIRNLERSKDIALMKHKPIGKQSGVVRWIGAGNYDYSMEFLFAYDTDPFLLDTLIRMAAQNQSYLFFGDLFQDRVYIEDVPAGAAPEMHTEWLPLTLAAKEG